MKRLSIITIVKDHKTGFLRTARSIVREKPDWCEWIVIDGASTDGTAEAAVELFGADMDVFVSERDGGIAEAFNKGIALSHGKYLLFLNAGDILADPSMGNLDRMLALDDGAPVIVGRIRFGNRIVGRRVSFRQQMMRNHLPHQGMLIQRELFKSRGLHDTDFKLAMDYEWSLRLADVWDSIAFSNEIVSDMEEGGVGISNYRRTFFEFAKAKENNFGKKYKYRLIALIFIQRMKIGVFLRKII